VLLRAHLTLSSLSDAFFFVAARGSQAARQILWLSVAVRTRSSLDVRFVESGTLNSNGKLSCRSAARVALSPVCFVCVSLLLLATFIIFKLS